MTTPEQLREEFYKRFGHIQAIKNEISGNQYDGVADWWLAKLEEAKKEAVEGERKRIAVEIKNLFEIEGSRRRPEGIEHHPGNYLGNKMVDKYQEALEDVESVLHPHSKDEK